MYRVLKLERKSIYVLQQTMVDAFVLQSYGFKYSLPAGFSRHIKITWCLVSIGGGRMVPVYLWKVSIHLGSVHTQIDVVGWAETFILPLELVSNLSQVQNQEVCQ